MEKQGLGGEHTLWDWTKDTVEKNRDDRRGAQGWVRLGERRKREEGGDHPQNRMSALLLLPNSDVPAGHREFLRRHPTGGT